MVKNLPVNTRDSGDIGSILWWGRSPKGGHGNPLLAGYVWSIGSQRVGHNSRDLACMHTCFTNINSIHCEY